MEKASKPDASKEVLRKRTMATWIQMRKLHVFISLRSWWEIFEAHQISQDIRCQSSFDSPTHQISPDYWHHGIIHIIYHIYIIPDIYISYIIYHIYHTYIYIIYLSPDIIGNPEDFRRTSPLRNARLNLNSASSWRIWWRCWSFELRHRRAVAVVVLQNMDIYEIWWILMDMMDAWC